MNRLLSCGILALWLAACASSGGGPEVGAALEEETAQEQGGGAPGPRLEGGLDGDDDGVPNAVDDCPDDPEDRDGFRDDDGCPEADNDVDGLLDVEDDCPNMPEDFNGFEDDDGCPEGDTLGTIEADDRDAPPEGTVYFSAGSAAIEPQSQDLLEALAVYLKAHPELFKLEIQGHDDARSAPVESDALSERRAQAVRDFLVAQGVEEVRFTTKAYGQTRPVDTNMTAAGRARNRRVEIVILELR